MEFFIKIILSYLLGSISGSLLIGKFKGVDIRQFGSGNAGGTNAFRTQGLLFALATITIDIGKGFLASKYIAAFNFPYLAPSQIGHDHLLFICGAVSILGHVYPAFHRFKGGKGAATVFGIVLASYPNVIPVMLLIWILTLIITGFVGLSTLMAIFSAPIYSYFSGNYLEDPYFITYLIIISIFLIYTHRSNIKRMLQRKENRFEKIMIFRKNDSINN